MTDVFWKTGVSGDWSDGADWSSGIVPGAGDDVTIAAAGNYAVIVSNAVAFNSLTLQGATLIEGLSGSLACANMIDLTDSEVDLDAANAGLTGNILALYSTVTCGVTGALGTMELDLQDGTIRSTVTTTIGNAISVDHPEGLPSHILAATGTSLTLTGAISGSYDVLLLGSAHDHGKIVLALSSSSILDAASVQAGTVVIASDAAAKMMSGTDNESFALTSRAGTLDLNGYDVTFQSLYSDGRLTNGATSVSTLTLDGNTTGHGMIGGNIRIEMLAPLGNSSPGTQLLYSGDLSLTGSGGITLAGTTNGQGETLGQTLEVQGQVTIGAGCTVSIDGSSALQLDGSAKIAAGIELDGLLVLEGKTVISGAVTGTSGIEVTAGGKLTLTNSGSEAVFGAGAITLTLAHAGAAASVEMVGGLITLAAPDAITNTLIAGAATIHADAGGAIKEVDMVDGGALDVAHGTTLTAERLDFIGDITVNGGSDNGTLVVENIDGGGVLRIDAGVLRIGAVGALDTALRNDLAAGVTLDLAGFSFGMTGLEGIGHVTSASAANLTLAGAAFDGVISGAISIEIFAQTAATGVSILTGTNSFTGSTYIVAGATLMLGDGGTSGSIGGSLVTDDGTLIFNRSDSLTFATVIGSSGAVEQIGNGTTTLTGANDFGGGLLIEHGTIAAAKAQALGSGLITLEGGELALTTKATVSNEISLGAEQFEAVDGTIAAAHDTTLVLTSALDVEADGTLVFGDAGRDGTVVLGIGGLTNASAGFAIEVAGGTLRLANQTATDLIGDATQLTIDRGATLDTDGRYCTAQAVAGGGALVNSSSEASYLGVATADLGSISGKLTVEVSDDLLLSGAGHFTRLALDQGATATLAGANREEVSMANGSTLVLGAGATLTGAIAGFGSGDTIDAAAIAFNKHTKASYNATEHLLTLTDGTHLLSLELDGGYTTHDFKLSGDGSGGSLVRYHAPSASVPHASSAAALSPHVFGPSETGDIAWHPPLHEAFLPAHGLIAA